MNARCWLGVPAILFASVVAAQSDSTIQKVRGWEGQRVTVMGSVASTHHWTCQSGTPRSLPPSYDTFDGRSGVVTRVDFPAEPHGPFFRLLVTLEGGDTLTLCHEAPLKFHAELDSARQLVGKAVWTRGPRFIRDTSGKTFLVEGTARLTIVGADWGREGGLIALVFRTARGWVGPLERRSINQGFAGGLDDRFRRQRIDGWSPMLEQFYFQDPRLTHRDWPAAMWPAIRRGEVVVGMTLEMADMACGSGLRVVGVAVGAQDKAPGRIYKCDLSDVFFKTFAVINGKVVRVSDP